MRTNTKIGWWSYIDDFLEFGSIKDLFNVLGEGLRDGLIGMFQMIAAIVGLVVLITIPVWIPIYLIYRLYKDYRSLTRLHDEVINNHISDFHARSVFGLLDRRYKQTGLRMYKEGQYDCILAVSDNNNIKLSEAKRRLVGDDPEDIDQTERMQMRVDKDLRL